MHIIKLFWFKKGTIILFYALFAIPTFFTLLFSGLNIGGVSISSRCITNIPKVERYERRNMHLNQGIEEF